MFLLRLSENLRVEEAVLKSDGNVEEFMRPCVARCIVGRHVQAATQYYFVSIVVKACVRGGVHMGREVEIKTYF
jgi:hypothetical protein